MANASLVVVDASVAVKWFISTEPGSVEAADLMARHMDGTVRLVAPTLLSYELLNVLARSENRGVSLQPAIDAFFEAEVELVEPSRELAIATAELIESGQLSANDAAYVALAQLLDCQLATADRAQERAVGRRVDVLRF